MRRTFFFAIIIVLISLNVFAQETYSKIWGKNGEKWDRSKIPDFTSAGFMGGKEAIPIYPRSVTLTDFGAKADGVTDNTAAFRSAIRECKNGGTVYIPEGRFLLTDTLRITRSNICIKGAGERKTVLLFAKGLEELYPDYNKHNKNQTAWSWSGAMILFDKVSKSGIENLTVQFPGDSLWTGHNWHERGYNAVGFSKKTNNSWLRNITITNADVGIWIEGSAHHITAERWMLDFNGARVGQKVSGHHGVNIYGGYNLLQDFTLNGSFIHDLSVESATSVYNVFRRGKGTDLCIDHHNHEQRKNLFTDIDAGKGSRIYASGGVSTPRGISYNEVYWNITAQKDLQYCNQWDTAESQSASNVCVGIKTTLPSKMPDEHGNWFETIDPSHLFPQDLYEAQMKFKKH